jgi:hypothetical protein
MISTDPDGTDDSDEALTTPYPPSDPQRWDRDEYWATIPYETKPKRRPKAFRPDLEETE